MIRRYITLIYWSAILSGLFAFPTAITAQEQTMTREERIKALERLKMEDARWGNSNCDADRERSPT